VAKKEKNCDPDDPADDRKGDTWDHVAIDAESRLVLSVVPGERTAQGPGAGLYLDFNLKERESIEVNLGLSYTSIANARTNLDAEAGDLSFDQVREKAQASWREMLGRISVSGGKEQDRVKFYTGLYHALLGRGICSDVNGAYPRNDGGTGHIPLQPDGSPQYNHYNSDSVWGTFWNLNQLWALAYPDFYSEFVRCHLDIYRDCGWLPDSIAAEKFVSGVGTDFAGVLVSGAYAWGIRDYNVQQAFAAVYKNETRWQNRLIGVGKADLKPFVKRVTFRFWHREWPISAVRRRKVRSTRLPIRWNTVIPPGRRRSSPKPWAKPMNIGF